MIKKSLKILHIEPELHMTELMKLTLEMTAEVDGCHSYLEAEKVFFNKYKSFKYNMIILEVFGRNANEGYSFINKLRHHSIDIPVIIVSICTQTIYKRKAEEIGIQNYFTKPFNPEEVEQCVRKTYMDYLKSKGITPKTRVIRKRK